MTGYETPVRLDDEFDQTIEFFEDDDDLDLPEEVSNNQEENEPSSPWDEEVEQHIVNLYNIMVEAEDPYWVLALDCVIDQIQGRWSIDSKREDSVLEVYVRQGTVGINLAITSINYKAAADTEIGNVTGVIPLVFHDLGISETGYRNPVLYCKLLTLKSR
ncbi:MAG: hypothetical protein WBB28_01510 [Crinalium sp.]